MWGMPIRGIDRPQYKYLSETAVWGMPISGIGSPKVQKPWHDFAITRVGYAQ